MTGPWAPATAARADLALTRNTALSVRCDRCGAEPGKPCRNQWSGEPHARLPAHLARIKAAESTT